MVKYIDREEGSAAKALVKHEGTDLAWIQNQPIWRMEVTGRLCCWIRQSLSFLQTNLS